jgi:hypothetical protein
LAFAVSSGSTAVAAEVETHEFSAALSLTGGCATSEGDPIPDPGLCPMPPGVPGVDHPEKPFTSPRSIATDPHGDVYVASYGKEAAKGAEGRIDIFNPDGSFITEVPASGGPESIAVDSEGNLYAFEHGALGRRVCRYSPAKYEPLTGEITYKSVPVVVIEEGEVPFNTGIAINPKNDHLFLHNSNWIDEIGSATEGNPVLDNTIGKGTLSEGKFVAVDATHKKIYASDSEPSLVMSRVRVFELNPPHKLLATFDGSTTPEGKFVSDAGLTPVAVEEATGDFFVYDSKAKRVDEFTEAGEYLGKLEHGFEYAFTSDIRSDNSPTSKNEGTLFVPSGLNGPGHSYAFIPITECAPKVESTSFANVTDEEAELRATINPCGLETHYSFEYTTQQSFEEEGFTAALVAGAGTIPAGGEGVDVAAAAAGLSPETVYRFRVVAENSKGPDEKEALFKTYLAPPPPQLCPNDAFRTEASAALPDCRAYELVTPADTNGRTPSGVGIGFTGDLFPTTQASPAGESVSFVVEGGSLPGSEGTGSFHGDPYLATRTPGGWSTSHTGPNGEEVAVLVPGSVSPDQGFSFWTTGGETGEGSAVIGHKPTHYVRYPGGRTELIGRGSLGTDPRAVGNLITKGGSHIIFSTINLFNPPVKLEEDAPPSGTEAVYDRTADEVTHVVSLLPGNITPKAGENAKYVGASSDGTGVAFSIGSTLYLRVGNTETFKIGGGIEFAGMAEGGARIFYLESGDLKAFDVASEETIDFTETGDIIPVNVSADGTAAYFVSPTAIPTEPNPDGASPQATKDNLYLSREGAISFLGTVTERDVKGEFVDSSHIDGLGLWVNALSAGLSGVDPSRTTSDGSVILFESRAPLTSYDPEGHAEIYRFDSVAGSLDCLSCSPTLSPASGEASLESLATAAGALEPFGPTVLVQNLRGDGRRAFFQSTEALVPTDTDGQQDVYEWEAQGVGSCERPEGCVYLISSGHSSHDDYLFGISASGNDVFIRSSDLLLSADRDGTPSIYDARVGGGFPEEGEEECEGEGCRPALTPPPALASPGTPAPGAKDNVVPPKTCPKGKHKVTKNGKTSCIKNKKQHHKHHRAGSKRTGAGK